MNEENQSPKQTDVKQLSEKGSSTFKQTKAPKATKKLSLTLTDQQYQSFVKASEHLLSLGIPVQPQALIQTLICHKNPDEIADDFLSSMRKLINEGKKKIRQKKDNGAGS